MTVQRIKAKETFIDISQISINDFFIHKQLLLECAENGHKWPYREREAACNISNGMTFKKWIMLSLCSVALKCSLNNDGSRETCVLFSVVRHINFIDMREKDAKKSSKSKRNCKRRTSDGERGLEMTKYPLIWRTGKSQHPLISLSFPFHRLKASSFHVQQKNSGHLIVGPIKTTMG